MSGHFRYVCEHGTVVSQCRCFGVKVDRLVPCPAECQIYAQVNPITSLPWSDPASDPLGDVLAAIDLWKNS